MCRHRRRLYMAKFKSTFKLLLGVESNSFNQQQKINFILRNESFCSIYTYTSTAKQCEPQWYSYRHFEFLNKQHSTELCAKSTESYLRFKNIWHSITEPDDVNGLFVVNTFKYIHTFRNMPTNAPCSSCIKKDQTKTELSSFAFIRDDAIS